MADLTIGRIGLTGVDLNKVQDVKQVNDAGQGRAIRIGGYLRGSTLAQTNYLRDSLLTIVPGSLVPITSVTDPEINGFYYFGWASVELAAEDGALNGAGYMPFEVVAYRAGEKNDIWFQSRLTGTVRSNGIGLAEAEVEPVVAPPPGFDNWWTGKGGSAHDYVARVTTAGSTMIVFRDKDLYTAGANPRWTISSSGFYGGAVSLTVNGYLRPGLEIPNGTTNWVLSNSLVKLAPNGTNKAYFNFQIWSGSSWEAAKAIGVTYGSSNVVDKWDTITCLRNEPHVVTLRLMGGWDKNIDRKTQVLDITLRRGAYHVEFRTNRSPSNGEMRLRYRTTGTAGNAHTPTGATAACGIRTTAGNYVYVAMMPSPTTWSTADGWVSSTGVSSAAFGYGAGTTGTGGNGYDKMSLQYFGAIGEEVRMVYR